MYRDCSPTEGVNKILGGSSHTCTEVRRAAAFIVRPSVTRPLPRKKRSRVTCTLQYDADRSRVNKSSIASQVTRKKPVDRPSSRGSLIGFRADACRQEAGKSEPFGALLARIQVRAVRYICTYVCNIHRPFSLLPLHMRFLAFRAKATTIADSSMVILFIDPTRNYIRWNSNEGSAK